MATPAAQGPQFQVRLLVRSDACGTIIGKGGQTISQMRQASGAQIKVDSAEGNSYEQAASAQAQGLPVPPDRAIRVEGLITSVHAALIDVLTLRYQPAYLDILPLYIVLLGLFPLLYLAVRLSPLGAVLLSRK